MGIRNAVSKGAAAGRPWLAAFCAAALAVLAALGMTVGIARGAPQTAAEKPNEIRVLIGRSVVLEHPEEIVRVSVANPEVVDAVAVSTRELVLNGKSAGTTSLIVWSKAGAREMFTVTVDLNAEPIQRQINETFTGEKIRLRPGKDTLILTGEVSSALVAERAAAMAASGAKTVINHLTVLPAGAEKQILLRIKFAEIDRGYLTQHGVNLLSTGALNTPGSVSTEQFSPPRVGSVQGRIGARLTGSTTDFTLNDLLSVFAFRPDLNLAVLLKALQGRNVLQILAEPNLITSNGREATFLAGGEFPFPVLQGGGNAGAVTIQFREFGVRVSFLPQLTAHHSIRLHVRPEVSALDYSNALSISGFLIPAISTRRVEADVELELGQSFAIAGLLDQRVTESLQKIPGLAAIPLLGNLFKSRSTGKNNSELLVVVTPEIPGPANGVRPAAVSVDTPFQPLPGAAGKKP
ncbi:MAG: pilus assembly protein N-terminal domain-containing protein [Acidobacteria bacterium]|nr:pilus assembly protein N-terminal domain-containing protein [Acidobacteriota bacterium]